MINFSKKRVDELGRIKLPFEVRHIMDIQVGDLIEIYLRENEVIIKKSMLSCVFCREIENLVTIDNYSFCNSCIDRLNDIRDK